LKTKKASPPFSGDEAFVFDKTSVMYAHRSRWRGELDCLLASAANSDSAKKGK